MSKADLNKRLVKLLAEPLIKMPSAVLFHSDEATLKEYGQFCKLRQAEGKQIISFNEFCKVKILALQPHIEAFTKAFKDYQERLRDDEDLTFESFIQESAVDAASWKKKREQLDRFILSH